MKRRVAVPALALAIGMVAAACGSSSKSSSSTTAAGGATTTASGGGATTTAAGGATTTAASNFTLSKPLKIVGLAEKPPEGAQAIPDFANGWDLAVKEINDAGGVGGQKIDFTRLPASPTDGNAAKNAFLQALDSSPNIVTGFVSSAVLPAVAPEVAKAGIPTLYMTTSPQIFVGAPNSIGSEWGFVIRPDNSGIANTSIDYLVKDLGKKNIGLLCVNNAFGQLGCDAAAKAITAAGATLVDREVNEVTDQDLTSKVLGLKGKNPDAVLAFTFPNNLVTFFNQAADNGLNVPIIGGSSALLAISTGKVKPNAIANALGTDDCVPAVDPNAKTFADAYKAAYGKTASYGAAEAYDSVKLAAAVVTQTKSTDPKALSDALRSITYKGVCDPAYKADKGQGLHHLTFVEAFDASGTPIIKKQVTIGGVGS